jgi:hypothetical protein
VVDGLYGTKELKGLRDDEYGEHGRFGSPPQVENRLITWVVG